MVSAADDSAAAAVALQIAQDGRVTDAAAILTAEQRTVLGERLAEIEARTGREVVIATVPSLAGRDIAGYARDLGNRWSIGATDDDGVVVLLAPSEQLVRIAVGQGLEDLLTDAVCRDIIDSAMLPEFREGRMHEGLAAGLAVIDAHL